MAEKIDYSKTKECWNCVHAHIEQVHTLPLKRRVFCVKLPPVTHAVFVQLPGVLEPKCYAETTYPEPAFACSQFEARGT